MVKIKKGSEYENLEHVEEKIKESFTDILPKKKKVKYTIASISRIRLILVDENENGTRIPFEPKYADFKIGQQIELPE